MKKYLSLSLILISWCHSYSQSSIGYPTIDTYIEIANPSESFSSETGLKLKHTESESNEREILLKFLKDLIPSDGFEQVLLKLVKTGGDEGNVSVVGTSSGFGNSTTWNSAPSLETPFAYGGIKEGEALYLDVTEYINAEASSSSSVFAFKLFTNSIINSPIVFGSNESPNESDRPQLQFYSSSKINAPLYDIHGTTTIDMDSRGNATGEIIKDHNEENAINNYGGWEHGTSNATGFFRAEKDCDNTWHIIDPDGHFFYSAGLNSVDINGGLSFPNELNDLGINTLGSWSDETIQNIAYTPRFNVMASFKNTTDDISNTYSLDVLPVFESDFENFCNELVEENVTPYVNDPWVLGYFLDNELPFHKNQLSLSLELSRTNAQYIAADNWMSEKYGSGYSTNNITNNDEADYQGYVAETYFEIVTKAFRAVDPNHMLIGTRLHGGGKYIPQLFEASGKYVDVVSVNYYSRFEPEEDVMQMWIENADKPFMITEFYVKGEDTGLDNSSGAGWKVGTQEDRAKWFENWMLKLLRNKGNVGFHWFRFIDKTSDDSNKGLYDDDYNIYEELGASIEKISKSIYTLRSQILYGSYNYNGCSSVNVDAIGSTGAFVPDPNKTYYIDSAIHNARLAATGESNDAYTTNESTTGSDVEWKFVAKGNGYWHIQRAGGGTRPRLRRDNSPDADMQETTSSGTWTYYEITTGYIDNSYFLTLPDAPVAYNRLQINSGLSVKMVPSENHNRTWESFFITEAESSARKDIVSVTEGLGITIYPNPVSSTATITNAANTVITIFDMNSNLILKQPILNNNEILDLSILPTGIYFAEVKGGTTLEVIKLVKE